MSDKNHKKESIQHSDQKLTEEEQVILEGQIHPFDDVVSAEPLLRVELFSKNSRITKTKLHRTNRQSF